MDHKLLEAKATTTTDLGEFTALAAAYSVDRTNERILPGAFKSTIARWNGSGKQIPLHWDHSGDPEDIIGTVDPKSMRETDEGLEVKGKLDLEDSEVARAAWRSMKADRVGLSFGYMVTEDGQGEDGVRELKSVDLFEVTITPAPANPDTRFIGLKSIKEMDPAEMREEITFLRKRLDEMEAALAEPTSAERPEEVTDPPVEDRKHEEPEGQVERQDQPNAHLRSELLKVGLRTV